MPESLTDNTDAVETQQPPVTDVIADSSPADSGAKADSPPVDKKAEKPSFLDIVKDAVNKTSEATPPVAPEAKQGAEDPKDAALKDVTAEDGSKMSVEDLKGLHPKTKQRMQTLLTTIEKVTKERDSEKVEADLYRNLRETMHKDGITDGDANEAFSIMSDFIHRPEDALVKINALRDKLMLITGKTLPDDLAAQVNDGLATEEMAKETARLRLEAARNKADRERSVALQSKNQFDADTKRADDLAKVGDDWDKNWRKTDPDYLKKADGVLREVKLRLGEAKAQGKLPTDKAGVIKIMDAAKAAYEKEISGFIPKRREITHVSGGSASGVVSEKPKTLAEAIAKRINK